MAKHEKPPELPQEVAEALKKTTEGAAQEIGATGNNPRLSLDASEIKAILRMSNEEFSSLLLEKGISDFTKPVLLVTPDGTAEEWMRSAEQIRAFLRRHDAN